jgi:hypothetical protein
MPHFFKLISIKTGEMRAHTSLPLTKLLNIWPFKSALKEQYTRWMGAGEHGFMPTGKIKRPDVEQLC